jgi:hypothetical protein
VGLCAHVAVRSSSHACSNATALPLRAEQVHFDAGDAVRAPEHVTGPQQVWSEHSSSLGRWHGLTAVNVHTSSAHCSCSWLIPEQLCMHTSAMSITKPVTWIWSVHALGRSVQCCKGKPRLPPASYLLASCSCTLAPLLSHDVSQPMQLTLLMFQCLLSLMLWPHFLALHRC